MPQTAAHKPTSNPNKAIWYFLICWTLLNALQAYTLELHGDEAYYWMYSRFLAWGYFDHPPMVAIFIRIGDSMMHNELGLRLLTVITNSVSVYVMWLIVKPYQIAARWFIVLVSGLFIFHIYGFTTTPDSPLLFFTVLFYYAYQRYAVADKWHLALILAVIIACLLYSKYHGILLIGFTLLSNLKLLRRPSFWAMAALALLLFVPHILWQIANDFPSIKYHLIDRSADRYDIGFTLLYPLGQLAMAGPLIGWFLFYSAFKIKVTDSFLRALAFNSVGTFLFFMLNTFKGNVEVHWTLIAFVPLIMLVLVAFKQRGEAPHWFYKLAIVNIAVILFIRAALLFQFPFVMNIGQLKSYFGFRVWAAHVHQRIGNNYLIIQDGFQDPSKYNYYTNSTKAYSYDSRYYRRTQYDLWPVEERMQHHKVYYMFGAYNPAFTTDSIVEPYNRVWYTCWVNNMRSYQKVGIDVASTNITAHPGEAISSKLTLHNPYPYTIGFGNVAHSPQVWLEACFAQDHEVKEIQQADSSFNSLSLKPGTQAAYTIKFKAPKAKGHYELYYSIRTFPFDGSKNSPTINLEVQ